MILRAAEALTFLALATGLHALAFVDTGGGRDAAPARDALPALQAAPQLAALVERWDQQPEIAAPPDMVVPPQALPDSPVVPKPGDAVPVARPLLPRPDAPHSDAAPESLPEQTLQMPDVGPDIPALGAMPLPQAEERPPKAVPRDSRPGTPPVSAIAAPQRAPEAPNVDKSFAARPETAGPARSLRPQSRPDRPVRAARQPAATARTAPKPTAKSAPGAPAVQARSARKSQQSPAPTKKSATSSLSGAAETRAISRWGAQITSRIHARASKPRGSRSGKVRLSLTVSPAGRLLNVGVSRSSGDAKLDAAALQAARNARYPRAPKGLSKASYSFGYTLAFR